MWDLNTFIFMWILLKKDPKRCLFFSQAALKAILFSKKEFYMPLIIPEGIYVVSSSSL